MKFSEFEEEFLVAAYQEAEIQGTERVTSGDLLDRYPLRFRNGWVYQVLEDLRKRGLIRGRGNVGDERSQRVFLTAAGMKEAETLLDRGVGTFRLDVGDGIGFPPADHVPEGANEDHDNFEAPEANDVLPTSVLSSSDVIQSSAWTGIETRLARDPVRVEQIKMKVRELDAILADAGLSNHEMAKARAITEALVKLVESPEPEWKAIILLLQSPALGAALNLASLVQLIFVLMTGAP